MTPGDIARGNRRLLKLAEFIGGLKSSELRLDLWLTRRGDGLKPAPGCGSVLCVGGWASAMPAFNRAGLTLVGEVPMYRRMTGYAALEEFFSLSIPESNHLFMDEYYPDDPKPTPAFVARRIRALVRKREARV